MVRLSSSTKGSYVRTSPVSVVFSRTWTAVTPPWRAYGYLKGGFDEGRRVQTSSNVCAYAYRVVCELTGEKVMRGVSDFVAGKKVSSGYEVDAVVDEGFCLR
jgi:hypothetical protein